MSGRQFHSRETTSEEALFLAHDEKVASLKAEVEDTLMRPRRSRTLLSLCRNALIPLLHVCFLAANVAWSTANLRHQSGSCSSQGSIYEPSGAPYSEHFTQYNLPIGVKTPFTVFDRSVADEAWASISMKQGLGWLKVPQEKVDQMQQSSVGFDDGSGYFFGMDVFHQLHCLNYLRKKSILYNHLYASDIEDEQIAPEFHIPHCIDSIRLSLQCHADLSLVPQRWADGWLEPWAVWTNKHACRDFAAVRDWAAANAPETAGRLRHPGLGAVVSGRLNLSALPIWQEAHDPDVVPGHMPVCRAVGEA